MTKRKLTPRTVLNRLRASFQRELGIRYSTASALLGGARLYDKAYELSCLLETIKELKVQKPSRSFTLMGGTSVKFRTKGGPINRGSDPFIEVRERSLPIAELWVDVEFMALSAWHGRKAISYPTYGLAHELDVTLVRPGTSGRPKPDEIFVGVEAKHRGFNKALLKELLGVRREMTLLNKGARNPFAWWAVSGHLPVNPPSGLVLYCSSHSVGKYADPADFWGIKMEWKVF